MHPYDQEYKRITLRIGFAVLLMFVLLQGLMTALGVCQVFLSAMMTETAADVLYWGTYCVFYLLSFMLPVPFFALIARKAGAQPIFWELRLPKHFWLVSAAAVGMITAAGQINSLLLAPFSGDSAGTDMLLDLMGRGNGHMVVLIFVMLVIVPPFCEELLFRGVVLGNLLPYGKGVAIVGSALLFAAMHQSFSQFLYTAVAGVLLGVIYAQSRSIWPSTLIHMINNMISFVQMLIFARVQDQMLANRIVLCMNMLIMLVGIIAMLVLIALEKKKKQGTREVRGLFGMTPDRAFFEKPRVLSPGMAVKGFLSPSIVLFVLLSLGMAVFNLIVEAML